MIKLMAKTKKITRKTINRSTTRGKKRTNRNSNKKSYRKVESDRKFFLKVLLFIILGSQWVHIFGVTQSAINIPAGLVLGLVFAQHEHFIIDRKIELQFFWLLLQWHFGYP